MKARVLFKMEGEPGEETPLAVFLDPESRRATGMIGTYAHVGQHSQASIEYVEPLRNATPEEYAPLRREMEEIVGYELEVSDGGLDVQGETISENAL